MQKSHDVTERMKEIFSTLFGVSPELVNQDSSQDSIPNWDSLQQLNLVTSIEQEFGIVLGDDDIVDLLSFGLAVNIVEKKLADS
jgi:acyl carrier protein